MKLERRDRDERRWLHRLLVVLALVLTGIHLYLGFAAPFVADSDAARFIVIAVLFVSGIVVYFTSLWRPIYYLVGTALALYLGQLWLLGGMQYFLIGAITGVVSTAFMVLTFYLFYREEEFFAD
ncbi:hypothetical protein SAMN04488063_0250 [Halopelagius inordinatus]|uniref:Uncharacterized protein n=1 Tax=Halopelagius inordinatus TaxID=553467 RepID=A0A1I2LK76_9EURY|nr:hypothetical protein [Halopelagius inordinatus]SFF77837.1 hypothetical protein SAMN04488063_0250 [Halopelagius inordinatus]